MQGIILLIAGLTGLLSIVYRYRNYIKNLNSTEWLLISLFIFFCLLSLIVNPHKAYDFLGSPYIRLGTGGVIACIVCGLSLQKVSGKNLVTFLYWFISLLAFFSVPYYLIRFHSISRIGGFFAQPDIFAVFLGCGLLLGLVMSKLYSRFRIYIWLVQLFLASILVLTETRAILFLVIILYLLIFLQSRSYKKLSIKSWATIVVCAIIFVVVAKIFLPNRVTSINYGAQSISYRLTLQDYALRSSADKPLFGYGLGNLADALACNKLSAASLQKTCHDGYFFNSSHDIFLDRILAVGWIGGLAFLIFVLYELWAGQRSDIYTKILTYCGLLIACYYLTNVTSVIVELLLWIILINVAVNSKKRVSNQPDF